MPETTTRPVARPLGRGERDPEADLARWPVDHFRGCPAASDHDEALRVVEFYREQRITVKKPPHDVTDDQRPSVTMMVAHCCLCGGITYHDL